MKICTTCTLRSILLLLLTSGVAANCQTVNGQVSVEIGSTRGTFKVGEPIRLTLVTSNLSDQAINIPVTPGITDATFACAAYPGQAQEKIKDSVFEERPSKRHTRSGFAYSLASNSKLKRTYDLNRRYNFDAPGQYTVRLRCYYSKDTTPIEVDSNSISFSVIPK